MSSSMRQTPLTCSGHTRPVVCLSFSNITPEGYYLISASKDGKPMLRQGDTGDWIGTFEGHKGAVWGATLNTGATMAATGAADFTAKIWDALTGAERLTFPHKHIVRSVDFSPDNSKLLTSSQEKLLRIFDLNRPESEPLVFSGHTDYVKTAIFSPDAKRIISASDDKSIRVWDTRTCEEIRKFEIISAPTSMELSRDGHTLALTYGSTVSFWDVNTYEEMRKYEVPTTVMSASLHPQGATFVCGGTDFKMYKFDYNSGEELESFKGHFGPIHCVRFSPDGELYASGSEDGTLRLWQTTVGKTYGLWKCMTSGDGDGQTVEA